MKVNSVDFIVDKIKETEDLIQIPTIVTIEGVQNGGHKPFDEIKKSAIWLNGKPFVPDGHPQVDGKFVQVTSPHQASGFMSDTMPIEGFDVDGVKKNVLLSITNLFKADKRNAPIMESIERGDTPAVSVGFWDEEIAENGEFEGEKYEAIETDIYYDHLARVLDGACSVEDGCGMGADKKDTGDGSNVEPENTHTTMLQNIKTSAGEFYNHFAKNSKQADEIRRQEVEIVDEKEAAELTERADKLAQENNDLQGKVSEFEERLKEMEANEESARKELDKIKAEEDKVLAAEKAELIEEITKANGEEPEKYEDWNICQLTAFRDALIQNVKKADKLVIDQETGQTETNGLLSKTEAGRTVWADNDSFKEAS